MRTSLWSWIRKWWRPETHFTISRVTERDMDEMANALAKALSKARMQAQNQDTHRDRECVDKTKENHRAK